MVLGFFLGGEGTGFYLIGALSVVLSVTGSFAWRRKCMLLFIRAQVCWAY
jgi:hypothetical protein